MPVVYQHSPLDALGDEDGTITRAERERPPKPRAKREFTAEAADRIQRFLQHQPHGTRYRYDSGCKCAPCTLAASRERQARRARKFAERGVDPLRHGLYVTYVDGCHCTDCRAAARDYQRERRARAREA